MIYFSQQQLCKNWADVINLDYKSIFSFYTWAKQTYFKCPTFAKLIAVGRNYKNMHGNVWATLYLTAVPSVLIFLIAIGLWLKRKKTAIVATIGGVLLLFLPASILISNLSYEKREMKKREGIYAVSRQHNLEELCPDAKVDSLLLTLKQSGEYAFNYKPCFADRQTGKWKWTDDMVGTYAEFEINIRNSAYFDFNEGDTLQLVNGNNTYLTFARKALTK